LLLSAIACSNSSLPGNLAIWQNAKWPQYTENVQIDKDGLKTVTFIEATLESGNHFIQKYENDKDGNRVCETLLTDFEDYLERNCISAAGQIRTMNTLDGKGRLMQSDYIDSNSNDKRHGEYEYTGQNEVFRSYRNGVLDATVLGEKFGDRTKYTIWVNNANAPSIHVRDYKNSGEGHEVFVSGGIRETSQTKVFRKNLQKITLNYEISQDYPDGVIYGKLRTIHSSGPRIIEEDYRIDAKNFDFDAAIDYETASRIAELGIKFRSHRVFDEKPAA
jgi:hypothetical protein